MKNGLLIFFAVGTLIMVSVMYTSGKDLKTDLTPHGIINLEFARNKLQAQQVYNAWYSDNGARIVQAKQNTYYDFIFLLCYAPFLFLVCKKLLKRNTNDRIAKTGMVIAKGALIAGFLDVLENLGMLQTLNGNITESISLFTSTASIIKWMLVAMAILFILFLLIRKLITRG